MKTIDISALRPAEESVPKGPIDKKSALVQKRL